ncbi:MAG TPA: hypothetical protein VGN97_21945 [Mesorhizobium sp.]|nr:hypothetical protein [Mesorhizobium sp.]
MATPVDAADAGAAAAARAEEKRREQTQAAKTERQARALEPVPVPPVERAILRRAGSADVEIDAMSREERLADVRQAIDAGLRPSEEEFAAAKSYKPAGAQGGAVAASQPPPTGARTNKAQDEIAGVVADRPVEQAVTEPVAAVETAPTGQQQPKSSSPARFNLFADLVRPDAATAVPAPSVAETAAVDAPAYGPNPQETAVPALENVTTLAPNVTEPQAPRRHKGGRDGAVIGWGGHQAANLFAAALAVWRMKSLSVSPRVRAAAIRRRFSSARRRTLSRSGMGTSARRFMCGSTVQLWPQ